MGRELSGVVACVQEIELASIELEEQGPDEFVSAVRDIKVKSQAFLKGPSIEKAEEYYDFLKRGREKIGDHRLIEAIFRLPVTVDGIKTSLEQLFQELEEVIEDLREWLEAQE